MTIICHIEGKRDKKVANNLPNELVQLDDRTENYRDDEKKKLLTATTDRTSLRAMIAHILKDHDNCMYHIVTKNNISCMLPS